MITGGVKFFDKNYSLLKNGATIVASSNDAAANRVLDISRYTQWESIGSNDITTETLTITLGQSRTIDSILLADINFKSFEVKYFNGSTYSSFTNVVGINNVSKAGILETSNAYSSAFYQFDSVTTNQIQITISTTQIADQDKYMTNLFVTNEIGTFEGFPRVKPTADRNETKATTLSRRSLIQKTYETNEIGITFKTHPYQNDVDIVENIFNREEPFLVYPCGGRTGTTYFKIEQKSWKLEDIFNMQMTGKLRNEFEKGVYLLGVNKTIKLEEHV